MADGSIMELAVMIRAVDYFSGPLRAMVSSATAAEGKFAMLNDTMKMMGKSTAEIDAINASLNKMADQKAFGNIATDLQSIGMAKEDIAAMEGSYMRMAQYQRDMAAAQARYAAGKDLVASGTGDLMTGALGAFGIVELVKQAADFQTKMTTIQNATGATTKQITDLGYAIQNTSAQVSKFTDYDVAGFAQQLATGGFNKPGQIKSLLLPVSQFAEVQQYEGKSSDATTSVNQAIELAHTFGNYDPKSFSKFLDTFNKYSIMQPGNSSQLYSTLNYLEPIAKTMGMNSDSTMALSAIANRVGLTGTHGGTNSADFIMRLIPGLVGGTSGKAMAAMKELGFVNANGQSTFFDKKGKIVNANQLLSTMIADSKKYNPEQLTQKYKDIFGLQGFKAAALLGNPKAYEQLTNMQKQLGKTPSMQADVQKYLKTPEGQMSLMKSNSMILMQRVGQQLAISLNPAITSMNKLLDSALKFSQAHPGIAKLIGDFALMAVGGKLLEGTFKILKGNFNMLTGFAKMFKLKDSAGQLTGFAKIASNVGKSMKKFGDFTGITKMISKFGEVTKLTPLFSRMGGAIKLAFTAFAGLGAGPITLIIAGIAVAAFLIIKNWGKIGPFVKKLWNDVKSFTLGVWKVISPTIMSAVKSVSSTLKSAWGGIVSFVKSIMPPILQIVHTVWPMIKTIIVGEMNAIWIEIKTVGTIIGATFKALWTMLVPVVETAWNLIRDYIKTAWDLISGIIKIGLDLLTGNWKGAWRDFQNLTKTLWSDVGKIFKDGWQGIQNIAKGWATAAMQWGKDIVNGLANGVKSMFGNAVNTVKNLGGQISGAFKHMLGIASPSKVFMDHGKFIVQGLVHGINQNSGLALAATQKLANGVTNSFNSKTPISVGSNRGSASQYTDNSQIHFQAGSIVINPQPGQDAETLTKKIMNELGKQLKKQGYRTGNNPVNAW